MVKTRFFSKTADECAEYEFLIVVEKNLASQIVRLVKDSLDPDEKNLP